MPLFKRRKPVKPKPQPAALGGKEKKVMGIMLGEIARSRAMDIEERRKIEENLAALRNSLKEEDPKAEKEGFEAHGIAARVAVDEQLLKGLRLGGARGGVVANGYEGALKMLKDAKDSLKSYKSFKAWSKQFLFGKVNAGPIVGLVVYPVWWGFRIIRFPLRISSRMFARYIARREIKQRLKEFKQASDQYKKENGKPMPTLVYLAQYKNWDKMSDKERKKEFEKLMRPPPDSKKKKAA